MIEGIKNFHAAPTSTDGTSSTTRVKGRWAGAAIPPKSALIGAIDNQPITFLGALHALTQSTPACLTVPLPDSQSITVIRRAKKNGTVTKGLYVTIPGEDEIYWYDYDAEKALLWVLRRRDEWSLYHKEVAVDESELFTDDLTALTGSRTSTRW
jgi:hypothetical protein